MAYSNSNLITPSAASRGINCPMSVFISQGLPDLPTSEYAIEGSKGHAVADPVLRFKLGLIESLGSELVDPEMLRHANAYADHIVDTLKPFQDETKYQVDSWVEKKLTYKEGLLGGTCDFVCVVQNLVTKKNYAYIIDYKYGRGIPVDAKDNWQLLSYAMCLNKMLASLEEPVYIDNFILGIYQPRGKDGLDNENPYNEVEYTIEEISPKWDILIETLDIVSSAIANMDTTHLVTKAGSWCHFCKARDICDVKNEKKQEKIKELYTSFIDLNPVALEKGKKKVNKINLEFLSLEDLAYLALNKSALTNFIKGASEFAIAIMKQGTKIPGCKLVETKPNREFIDDKESLVAGLVELGVEKPVEIIEKVITLTSAEEAIFKGKKLSPEEKQSLREKFDKLLKDSSTLPTGIKLVDENSKGDEITINDDEHIESLYASMFS